MISLVKKTPLKRFRKTVKKLLIIGLKTNKFVNNQIPLQREKIIGRKIEDVVEIYEEFATEPFFES